LRTENIGIKPGNTFKSTFAEGNKGNIQPTNLLRDGNRNQEKKGGCC